MQDIPADTEKRGPSSRVLQEVIRQARQWSVQKLSCADCVAASSTCHQTLLAFELRFGDTQLGPSARNSAGILARASVIELHR